METGRRSLLRAISDPKTKAVSFDVFDTLLVRPFWEPSDMHLSSEFIAELLGINGFPVLRGDFSLNWKYYKAEAKRK